MDKNILQEEWDLLLLNSWKRNTYVINLMRTLSILHNPEHDSNNFLVWCFAQKLKRFPTYITTSNAPLYVRSFIGGHCMKLNQYLFDHVAPEELLPIIDSFYWARKSPRKRLPRTKVVDDKRVKVTKAYMLESNSKESLNLMYRSYASKHR